MPSHATLRAAALAAALCLPAAWPAQALDSRLPQVAQANVPPGAIPDAPMDQVDPADAGALVLRIDRLENELRRANGQIEQLQNQQQRLLDQLKRFQEDVDQRLRGAGAAVSPPPLETSPNIKSVKKSDAFDPSSDPKAVGAPKPIGAAPPSAPLAKAPPAAAPLDLGHGAPADAPSGSGVSFVDGPRNQYNQALATYRQGQYELAETQTKEFLAANAQDRLVPEAIFLLGETYFQRSRPREAAEQYLRLSKDYAKSSRAPEGLMRLGQSLVALGNGEQACATFGEVGKRYPSAPAAVRKSVEREIQKNHC